MGAKMRHVLGIAGVTAAAVLLIVSAAMNWRFGYTLGKSDFEFAALWRCQRCGRLLQGAAAVFHFCSL